MATETRNTKALPTQAPNAEEMRGIWVVKPGFYLHVPRNVDGTDRTWQRPGGAIDCDDAFVRAHVKGQEHKLTKPPKGETIHVPALPVRMKALQRKLEQRSKRKKELAPAAEAAAKKGSDLKGSGIQPPDSDDPPVDPKADDAKGAKKD